jgi:hypothetical protein
MTTINFDHQANKVNEIAFYITILSTHIILHARDFFTLALSASALARAESCLGLVTGGAAITTGVILFIKREELSLTPFSTGARSSTGAPRIMPISL